MDQETPHLQLVESMADLKETQESQQKALQEFNQQTSTPNIYLEFPKFSGVDPTRWIYRAQQFFQYYQTPLHDRFLISSIHMEGRALAWYMCIENSKELTSWEGFTRALETRFDPSPYYDPVEALLKLRQTSTVEDFQSRFELHAIRTNGLPETFKLACYLNGLREDIKYTVKMCKPTTVTSAFALARMQEENILSSRHRNEGKATGNTNNHAVVGKNSLFPVQRISPTQMKERRDGGLCYSCDKKWSLAHVCKAPKLYLMEAVELGNQEEENDQWRTETNVD